MGIDDTNWPPASYLGRLSAADQEALLKLGQPRTFEAGRILLSEGKQGRYVELILQGFVKVSTEMSGLGKTLLAVRGAGDIVGELAAISGGGRSATVTTCGPVTCVVVHHGELEAFLKSRPDAMRHLMAVVGDRLVWANRRRIDFAACPAKARVARVLCDLAAICGRRRSGTNRIEVELTQPELASMVGAKEVTVQKALRELRDANVISRGYRKIGIIDMAGLEALCERVL